jgi:hypothetical protein
VTAWLRSMGAVSVMHIEPQTRCFEPEGAEAALQLEAAFIHVPPRFRVTVVLAVAASPDARPTIAWRACSR